MKKVNNDFEKKTRYSIFFKIVSNGANGALNIFRREEKLGTNCNICNKTNDIINNKENIFKINRRSFRCYIYTKNHQIQNTMLASEGNFMLI